MPVLPAPVDTDESWIRMFTSFDVVPALKLNLAINYFRPDYLLHHLELCGTIDDMKTLMDLTGQRYGYLTVLSEAPRVGTKRYWHCLCDCGNTKTVQHGNLRDGQIVSCGCKKKQLISKKNSTHGMTRSPEYNTWIHMLKRCNERNRTREKLDYHDRGIRVCDRWQGENGFINFFEDMGKKPSEKHSIDRIDNNAGYSPENCRWVTATTQNRNKRNNHIVEFHGERITLGELAERHGILCQTLHGRVLTLGWDIERAITTPVCKYVRHKKRSKREHA